MARGDLTRARGLALRYAGESGEAILHQAEMLHEAVRAGYPAAEVTDRISALAERSDGASQPDLPRTHARSPPRTSPHLSKELTGSRASGCSCLRPRRQPRPPWPRPARD